MIYIECKADYTLVTSITDLSRKDIVHGSNKGNICKQLRGQRNCKALLDQDPLSAQPRYLKEARVESDLSQYDLKLLHGTNNNYLVILCPRLEAWILKSAKEASVDVSKYDLPNDEGKLHGLINISLEKFENLLEDLKGSSGRLKALKRLLESQN